MAESNNLQGLASKITEIFTSATKGVEETTNKLNGLSTALENLSKVKTDDLDKFANNLKAVINFEKEYTQLATKKIELEKMSADAERALIALNEKMNEVAKKNKATAEDLARVTENRIKQKQVELEAIKGVSTVIDGEIRNTRRLLIEKERISTTTKEQTNLLKAEAAVEKERQRGLAETAAKYNIIGNSMKELEAQNKSLREITKSTDIVKNSDELDKYNTIISANSFLIKANSDAATQQALNIGNYKSALESNTGEVISNAQALDELKQKYFSLQQQLSLGGGLDALQGDMAMSKDEFEALEDELQKVAKEILNIEKASKGIKVGADETLSFRTRMRDLREEILSMEMQMAKGVQLTDEQKQKYKELNKELILMTDLQGDVNKKMSTLSSDTLPFDKVVTSVNMAASSMQIYTAAMDLAGVSQKSYEETMRTFASLQSMINGLNTVAMQLQDGATLSVMLNTAAHSKNIVVKTAAIAVQKTLNAVIAASPYIATALALGALIYEISKYIYEASEAGKISKELKIQVEALGKAMEGSIDDYAETAVKINNYRLAMESSTITAKGKENVLKALNKELEKEGIHFNDILEAQEWLINNSPDYIIALQKQAMATAMFSLQTELLKDSLKKLKEGFVDLEERTWGESMGNVFGAGNTSLKEFRIVIRSTLHSMKSFIKDGLDYQTSVQKSLDLMKKKGSGAETYVWEQIAKYAENAVEEGEDFYDVMQKLYDMPPEELPAFLQEQTMQNVLKENEDIYKQLLGSWAEYLKTFDEAGKGVGTKTWTKNLKLVQENFSKLYQIYANELNQILKTYENLKDMGLKPSEFLDYNLFQQLSGQIVENFEQMSLSSTKFTGENEKMFTSLLQVQGEYSESVADMEEKMNLERLKKLQSLQEKALETYAGEENTMLKKKADNIKKLEELEEEYNGNITEERARALEFEIKNLQNEQKEVEQSLQNLEKLRLEHQKTTNDIQQMESEMRIKIIEWEIEREKLLREDANNEKIAKYEEEHGVLSRILGTYSQDITDIKRQQRLDELNLDRERILDATRNAELRIQEYEKEQETLISIINNPEIDEAQRISAENRLSIVNATIESIKDVEKNLSNDLIKNDNETSKIRLEKQKEENEKRAEAINESINLTRELVSQINAIWDNYDAARQAELDKELERIETWKTAKLEAIENTAMSDEDRIAKTSEIEKEAAKKSYEIEVAKWQLEVQAAKRKKVMDAASAASSYAVAMIKALQYGLLAPLVMGLITAVYTAQLAAIMSQPLPEKPTPPQYAEGTNFHKGGLAVVGDGGKQEVIEASGKTFLSPSSATLVDLPRGARVYKDYNDYVSKKWVQNKTNGDTFDDFGIINAIQKNRSSISLYFDRNGIYHVSKNGIDRDTYIQNTLKLSK